MRLDQETINARLTQLASHRQRLALLLQQQAKLGAYSRRLASAKHCAAFQ
jgi:hypothetical protein